MKSLTPAFLVLFLATGCATEPDSPSSGDDGLGGAREVGEPGPEGTGGAESDEDPVTNETGGASTGGASTGGASTGGASTGGSSTGGASTGGASTGGASTGGASTGGTGGSVPVDPFLCDAGTWDHDANDTTECAVCAAGTYCAGGEAPSAPCDAGEWDDDADASTVCQPKSACAPGTHVSDPGSAVSDRSCANCLEGTYTAEDNLSSCLPQADCVAGQYALTLGSTSQLRECATCEAGSFSDSENAAECTPHSTCELDEQVVLPGSMTQDLKCACVYYVSASFGDDEADGTSWLNAKATVPAAIAASGSDACEIWVELGTYYPTDDGDQSVSITVAWGIDLYGGFTGTETYREERDFDLNETILSGDLDQDGVNDAANSNHVIYPGSNTIIDGFTIEQGRAYTSGNYNGAGIYVINASPTIQNCVIRNNRAAFYGAGLFSSGGALVRNTVFEDNAANQGGGAYINGRAYENTFDHVVFRQNRASLGGALASASGWAQIVDSSFVDNTCSGGGCGLYGINTALQIIGTNFSGNSDGVSQKDGGAILLTQDSVVWPTEVYISESTFSENDGFDGGAVAVTEDAFLQISRCEFVNNEAQNDGGGIYSNNAFLQVVNSELTQNRAELGAGLYSFGTTGAFTTSVTGSLFYDNYAVYSGGAVYGTSTLEISWSTLVENTAFSNTGAAVDSGGPTTLTNNIIDGNSSPGEDLHVSFGTMTVSYCTVDTGCSGSGKVCGLGNLFSDPAFVDAVGGDFRLQSSSPCVDSSNAALPSDSADVDDDTDGLEDLPLDLDGSPRSVGLAPDRGCYESQGL